MLKSRLALLLAALAVAAPAAPVHADPAPYSVTDLGPLAGNTQSTALGINAAGQVAGYSNIYPSYPNIKRSTLWTNGAPIAIPTLAGAGVVGSEFDRAAAVNNSGWVVGCSVTAGEYLPHAFLWTSANGIQDLGVFPGGRTSVANAINSSGAVAGYADNAVGDGLNHAFLWISGIGLRDLGTLGGQSSSASGINASNQVVGVADTAAQYQHAFLWSSAQGLQDLGVEPGDYVSSASAINDAGMVVGSSGSGQWSHAFLWSAAHGMQDLGNFGGAYTYGSGVNAAGQVVGSAGLAGNTGASDAYVWDSVHGMRDLNGLISASGWQLTQASAINSAGQIVGSGTVNGAMHAFLLTPTPPIAVTLSPASVVNGASSTATVSLSTIATFGPNPFSGGVGPGVFVQIASSKPVATFSGLLGFAPDGKTYLYIPQGQWQGSFTINTGFVTANTSAAITASFAGGSRSASLTITPTAVQSVVLSPASVVNGGSSAGTVTLATPAFMSIEPSGATTTGAFVKLASSKAAATFSGNVFVGPDGATYVYIPQGQTQATFTVNTGPVTANTTATISASTNGATKTANLTITPTLIQSLVMNPTSVINGGSSTGTVTLATPAFMAIDPFGNLVPLTFVKLASSSTAATFSGNVFVGPDGATYVYIPQGQTQATFTVNTKFVSASTSVKITASDNGSTKTANLTITPTVVQSIVLSPTSVINGGQSTGTVTLASPAFMAVDPYGNLAPNAFVKLASSSTAATFSGNVFTGPDGATYVYIPQGQTQATFTLNTGAVTATTTAKITASDNGSTKTANLTITPTLIQSIVLSPTSVINGGSSTGTVTLTSPAFMSVDPYGNLVPDAFVKLASSSTAATFSGNVFVGPDGATYLYIPQGQTQGTFTVNTGAVATRTTASITGSINGSTRVAGLTITP